ncbi:MAG: hypothetical protein GXO70_02755 [Acidobacteria bacterium]|nr:hypothetical protein [Acidobacteriota bacterium]
MAKPFVELVISSPFILFKGFLMGFLTGSKHSALYYFNQRSGIETETLKDHLKNWLGFENFVHVCLEEALSSELETAIKENHEKLRMEVISKRKIRMTGFDLKARFFDEEGPEHFRKELASIEDHLSVTITSDARTTIPAWQDVGVGVLATLPPYQHGIDATITGPLDDLLPFRQKLTAEILVDVTEIRLMFEDK